MEIKVKRKLEYNVFRYQQTKKQKFARNYLNEYNILRNFWRRVSHTATTTLHHEHEQNIICETEFGVEIDLVHFFPFFFALYILFTLFI